MYYSTLQKLKELSGKNTATNTSSQQEEEHLQQGKNLQGQKSSQEHEREHEQNRNDLRSYYYKYRDPPKCRRKTESFDEDIDSFKKLKNIRRSSAPINGTNYINRPSKMNILSDNDYRIVEESSKSSFDCYNIESPSNPPSLSPSSSTSSLNSYVDHLNNSFVLQQNNNNNNYYDNNNNNANNKKNYHYNSNDKMSLNTRTTTDMTTIGIDGPFGDEDESFSPLNKKVTQNPYENCSSYLSPAALFLANLAPTPAKSPFPDDEGQKVGEYVLGKIIGGGGFSFVRECYMVDKTERAAVKIVRKNNGNEDNVRIQTLLEREISIWSTLNHPNIVRIISVESMDFATFIFSEYCTGGTLLQYLNKRRRNSDDDRRNSVYGKKKNIVISGGGQRKRNSMIFAFDNYEEVEKEIVKGLCEDEARNIFLEIASAVRYLHEDMKLVHKDIKLDNILLDRNHHWKLCDFGLTESQNPDANEFGNIVVDETVRGSLAYCSPEQLKSKKSLKISAIDIWSLGVVLFALVTAQLPFVDKFEPRLQFKILRGKYDELLLRDADVSDELHNLLKGMFKINPNERLTITQILDHPWCNRKT